MFSYQTVLPEVQEKLKCFVKQYTKVKCEDPNPVLKNWPAQYWTLTSGYAKHAKSIKELEIRDDDVWLLSYPKCGTTWCQEMLWLMLNDLDFDQAKTVEAMERVPFLEVITLGDTIFDSINIVKDIERQRLVKSHLPVNLLPNQLWTKNPKLVYVARNPKDAAVSYYHHYRGVQGFRGNPDDFYDAVFNGNLLFGSYFHHVNEFWQLMKLKKNLLFITYEEMKFDMMAVLEKMNKFLEKDYPVDQLRELEEYLEFENMKKIPTANMSRVTNIANEMYNTDGEEFEFMRKGQVGSFKEEMSKDLENRFDKEILKWNGIHEFQKKWLE